AEMLCISPGESYWAPKPANGIRPRKRALKYHVVLGPNPQFRPPVAMPLSDHRKAARMLKHLHHLTQLRRGVHNRVESVRSTLDDWLQKEYDYDALPNEQFHEEYYYGRHSDDAEPISVVDDKQAAFIADRLAQ